uniref:Uncharacterized protein n=1 Tax=Acrobeloides nanus TaxID=290746 RepID=A0A914CBK2_9BILA
MGPNEPVEHNTDVKKDGKKLLKKLGSAARKVKNLLICSSDEEATYEELHKVVMEVNFIIASILILLSICSCIANLILAHYQMNTDCEQVTNPLLICAIIGIFLVSVIYGFLPYFVSIRV